MPPASIPVGAARTLSDTRVYALAASGVYGTGLAAMTMQTAQHWQPLLERAVRGNSLVLLILLTGGLITLALKHLVARARPSMLLALAAIAGISHVLALEHFPSDVLASAFIAAGCLGFWAPRVLGTASRWPPRPPWHWHRAQARGGCASTGRPGNPR